MVDRVLLYGVCNDTVWSLAKPRGNVKTCGYAEHGEKKETGVTRMNLHRKFPRSTVGGTLARI